MKSSLDALLPVDSAWSGMSERKLLCPLVPHQIKQFSVEVLVMVVQLVEEFGDEEFVVLLSDGDLTSVH